jgi:hypothetical protein
VCDVVFGSFPEFLAFVDEKDFLSNTHYGVHVVGNDNGGHFKFFGNIINEFIDKNGGLWIKA